MGIKVQYMTMIVDDLEESVSFYRDVLGFKEGYHVDTKICESNTKQSKNTIVVLNQILFCWFSLSLSLSLVAESICFLYHMNKYSIKY